MRKKFLSIIAIMFVVLVSITSVQATEGLFDVGAYNDIYRLSEQQDKIDLPFINVFASEATYDQIITHSGISIGDSTIDIDEKLEGVHIIASNDMVTIKGEVENAFIYGSNVVVEGKITGDTMILAPNVQILEGATVSKDIVIITNNLEIKGIVEGNVIATVSQKANISGAIKNDLRMMAQTAEITTEDINGDIYIETNADMTALKEKYPNAIIEPLIEEVEQEVDWVNIITTGIITVVLYSAICFFITKKDNNIVQKACKKIKTNTAYGIIIAFLMLMLTIILPIILIIVAIFGFGIIAWPVLIVYLGIILFVITTAPLIVGMTVFEAIKDKVGSHQILVISLIYIILYILTQITIIATYVNISLVLIALAIVMTMLTKKLPKEDKVEVIK